MRERITGVLGLGLLTGIVLYLALAMTPRADELLLVDEGDGGWSIAAESRLDLPGRSVEVIARRREVRLELTLRDRRGSAVQVSLRAVRTLDPKRLAADRARLGPGLDHLPEYILPPLLGRMARRLSALELYGPLRPRLAALLEEAANTVLARGCSLRLEGLRLRDVEPVEPPPLRLLILRLDGLALTHLERLWAEGRLNGFAELGDHGCLIRLDVPETAAPLNTTGLAALSRRTSTQPTLLKAQPPVVELPRPPLLNTSAAVRRAADELEQRLNAAARLLAAGTDAVVVDSGLLAEFARRWWPALQRYRELRYHERFPHPVYLDETALTRATAYGELYENLLEALDSWLTELRERLPGLTIVVVGSGGYGLRRRLEADEAAWGPVENAWLLLGGLHVRPGPELTTASSAAAALLEGLLLGRPRGPTTAAVLEPALRRRLLDGPPSRPSAVDTGDVER
ncbi:MAG: hypothetical protein GF399_12710 [Candidatus Coatesbacteria bacterium]|nr:hypothetical protein [Candidatus Coatesbacteria bacterium]